MLLRSTCAVVALLSSLACHPSRPVVDPAPRPDVGGSISGIVTASDGTSLGARKVVAVNMETGARVETSTATSGGYTMQVPPGIYRLELEVRAGETIVTTPEPTEVAPGDLDAGRNFVVAVVARR
ncbi:MAG: carboxypeptidase regulatory-like domain-containing protein [Acidobacteria bacterium]|nr:carboxypeptidase regulatory-like domain-containing protein [Acidobacteriota bacterium]